MASLEKGKTPVLIFDFGNVVAFFDYERACARLSARSGLPLEDILQRVKRHNVAHWVASFERGEIAENDFARGCCERLGIMIDTETFATCWADIFWLNDPVSGLVKHLDDRGYTLILGSNTNVIHSRHFRRQFATTLDRFDQFVLSHEVGHLKPAAEFFEACTRAAGAAANQCVFIDDLADNVAGAHAAGLHALQFQDARTLQCELRGLGIEVPFPLD